MQHSEPFGLHPYIYDVQLQTKNDLSITKERNFVDGFFENWVGDFLHPYGDNLFDAEKLDDSLFYCYLAGQSTNFHWYGNSLFSGAYTILFRELRCILEGLFIVYKIEKLNLGKTVDEKLDILEHAENDKGFYGGGLFKSSGFTGWRKYHKIYKELSSFIHFSYKNTAHVIKQIKSDGFPEVLDYKYDKTRFLKGAKIWKQMALLSVEMAIELAALEGIELSVSTSTFD
jgi:hypothetical protein